MGNREFVHWLEGELEKRNWKPADLARAAGIYTSTLSKILNEDRKIGPDVALSIAEALKLPPEMVFRYAGLLPEYDHDSYEVYVQQLVDLVRRLEPDKQRQIMRFALFQYREEYD